MKIAPDRLSFSITAIILPAAFCVLLTGLFWLGDRSLYHQAYYLFFALPALVLAIKHRSLVVQLFGTPVFPLFLLFSAYMLLSASWSDTDTSFSSLVKRPIYVAMLFVGVLALLQADRARFHKLLLGCSALAALVGAGYIAYFIYQSTPHARLTGYGALHNPLLTAHVLGVYAAMVLAMAVTGQQRIIVMAGMLGMLAILVAVLLLTGSRTPLVGLFAASLWLLFIRGDRKARWIMIAVLAALTIATLMNPDTILARGFSYRPEIWHQALLQILDKPWFGYGFDNNARFFVADLDTLFHDPHNFLLGVVHSGGVVGGIIWLSLLGAAIHGAWKHRGDPLVVIASTALVFGLAASMTEGDSFLSRPKEHWFLLWIPMSVLTAAIVLHRSEAHTRNSAREGAQSLPRAT